MRLLSFPDDVAIGGLEAQADLLADETSRIADEAEELALSLLRGDRLWRERRPADRRVVDGPAGPRRVA